MNKYHLSFTITVDCETYEEAYTLANKIEDFVLEESPEELSISDMHNWDVEADMDNEYGDEDE